MIELKDINKSYGTLQVLRNINLTINEGEIMAIVGKSGAGKTTLLQIAGTLDHPDSGTILYDGVEVSRLRDSRLSHFRCDNIGFVFQFHRLLPEFTALENVMIPAFIAGVGQQEAKAAADATAVAASAIVASFLSFIFVFSFELFSRLFLMSLFYTFLFSLSNIFMHIFKIILLFLHFFIDFMYKIKIIVHKCIIYKIKTKDIKKSAPLPEGQGSGKSCISVNLSGNSRKKGCTQACRD